MVGGQAPARHGARPRELRCMLHPCFAYFCMCVSLRVPRYVMPGHNACCLCGVAHRSYHRSIGPHAFRILLCAFRSALKPDEAAGSSSIQAAGCQANGSEQAGGQSEGYLHFLLRITLKHLLYRCHNGVSKPKPRAATRARFFCLTARASRRVFANPLENVS